MRATVVLVGGKRVCWCADTAMGAWIAILSTWSSARVFLAECDLISAAGAGSSALKVVWLRKGVKFVVLACSWSSTRKVVRTTFGEDTESSTGYWKVEHSQLSGGFFGPVLWYRAWRSCP